MAMRISVIIPALNEVENIRPCLHSVVSQQGLHEAIVVDGGSTDGTPALAAGSARVISAPRGRATQMNAGASVATGDVLLFLHADSRLAGDALPRLQAALSDARFVGGTFSLRFDAQHPLLRFYSFCTRFRFRLFHFGDQGIFVRRAVFEQMGGFAEIPFLEDLEFLRRLSRAGSVALARAAVTTSARRFLQHGIVRQQLWNIALVAAYQLGARPETLARFYSLHTSLPAESRKHAMLRPTGAAEPRETPNA
jgi:rSAM/selenodomain-associated transferase 2